MLAVITDRKRGRASSGTNIQWFVADVLATQQYYPFGMLMPGNASATLRRQYSLSGADYRYGFNGKEGDDEVKGIAKLQLPREKGSDQNGVQKGYIILINLK